MLDGLVLVQRERVWGSGARLGGDFVLGPESLDWLAEQLELVADGKVSQTTRDASPDHLRVFVGGGDHGQPINVNVINKREGAAVHGKTCALAGMSPEVARRLAADLRAHR